MAAATKQQSPEVFTGIVKMVMSGDTVIIRGQPRGGPPPERQLFLHAIIAPRLARRPVAFNAANNHDEKDEPHAWEAREFLREKLLGKKVFFTVEHKLTNENSSTVREFGFVYLGDVMQTAENIVETLLSLGFASVRRDLSQNSPDLAKHLLSIQATAKAKSRGKWSKRVPRIRKVTWNVDPEGLFFTYAQRRVKAIVEQVRDGSTIRVFLLPHFYYVTVMISGIKCPGYVMSKEGKRIPEPFADEAEFFTSSRLLQRNVEIILEATANNGMFLGSVIHPNGNIAEHLLLEGLARCVRVKEDKEPCVTGGMDKLLAAEKEAQDKQLRMWKKNDCSSAK